ncbi:MAG: pseudouridine synthase [Candidatus Xenobium sp.]|jgi:16S rRNA pseudouridine516 synthase|nr:rRNA pseudouridine synthase [Burkholderiales bacterium]
MALIRLDKLLSNLGYCTRSEARDLARQGRVLVDGQTVSSAALKVDPAAVTLDGETLDPEGLLLMLHKPPGYTCSHKDAGVLIYTLLPERYLRRNPVLSTIGRLDRDTTGLLLLTDDGALLHRLTSPRYKVEKVYEVWLERDLEDDAAKTLTRGGLMLPEEPHPLLPADLEVVEPRFVRLTLVEGRYHQVKRTFEALGNRVLRLHRPRFGALELGDLPPGSFRPLTEAERLALVSG